MQAQSTSATFNYLQTPVLTLQCILTVSAPSLTSTSLHMHTWWTFYKSMEATSGNARTSWKSTTSTLPTPPMSIPLTGGDLATHLKIAPLGICYLLLTLLQETIQTSNLWWPPTHSCSILLTMTNTLASGKVATSLTQAKISPTRPINGNANWWSHGTKTLPTMKLFWVFLSSVNSKWLQTLLTVMSPFSALLIKQLHLCISCLLLLPKSLLTASSRASSRL